MTEPRTGEALRLTKAEIRLLDHMARDDFLDSFEVRRTTVMEGEPEGLLVRTAWHSAKGDEDGYWYWLLWNGMQKQLDTERWEREWFKSPEQGQ